jgi:lysophospholipase L1-like esterase
MPHLVLLGDAILANRAHTSPKPDTATILGERLSGWTVTLLAAPGVTMAGVSSQLQRVPADVDLAVLSVGGNDALKHVEILQQPARSSAETLDALLEMTEEFVQEYDRVVQAARGRITRLLLCTIYEPPLVGEHTARRARVLLTLVNDQILRVAVGRGADVLDLRAICNTKGDFVMQIAPSATGAEKIADAIARTANGSGGRRVTVIAG